MLPIDVNPHQFDSEHGFVRGHLEFDRQLPDGILPPWHASVKDIHGGALKERLGIVYIALYVLCGMVAQNSV